MKDLSTALLCVVVLSTQLGRAEAAAPQVAVQPLEGNGGERLRHDVARLVRRHGFHVTTDLPKASGTGQYYTWAQDMSLTAFVAGDLETRGKYQRLTLLVWNGINGSVIGRWTASGPANRLPRTLARGFWRRLGPALKKAKAPGSGVRDLPPAPTMRIDASASNDDYVVGSHVGRRHRLR